MILIGIDPGCSGGMAARNTDSNATSAYSMPDTDTGILDLLKSFKPCSDTQVHVLCEKVGGFIGFSERLIHIACPSCGGMVPYKIKEGNTGSTMFTFGDNNGFIRGSCLALGYGYDTCAPRSWQKVYNINKGKTSYSQWKRILKDRAQKLFPELKVTLKTADALLILNVALRMPRIQSI